MEVTIHPVHSNLLPNMQLNHSSHCHDSIEDQILNFDNEMILIYFVFV